MTSGSQTALSCAVKLYNSSPLETMAIEVLRTPVEALLDTEARERGIPQGFIRSWLPGRLRAAVTFGELGSGFADDVEQLAKSASRALTWSSQVLDAGLKGHGLSTGFRCSPLEIPLAEIRNSIRKETSVGFEPSLDYLFVNIQRSDCKKFTRVRRSRGKWMKSAGEVMAFRRNFEETLQKADKMGRENYVSGFESDEIEYDEDRLRNPTYDGLLPISDGLGKGVSVERIYELTKIDKWFFTSLREYQSAKFSCGTIQE
ncbi:Glutamine-dependent carbamoyl-phosphate synthase [Gracilaria domingensis]|nr:Glutamine-dependent carbamoyl-phosphate synthase [Gracilaria domingensis]